MSPQSSNNKFVSVEPVNTVRHYDREIWESIDVPQPFIIQLYNKSMGGLDKPDIICSFYKPSLKCHRWYIYLWAHSFVNMLSNTWFLFCHNVKMLKPNSKFMPLQMFQANLAPNLVNIKKIKALSSYFVEQTTLPSRARAIQVVPTCDI